MLVHKGLPKNWGGECRDGTPTKLQCQNVQSALQVFYKNKIIMFKDKCRCGMLLLIEQGAADRSGARPLGTKRLNFYGEVMNIFLRVCFLCADSKMCSKYRLTAMIWKLDWKHWSICWLNALVICNHGPPPPEGGDWNLAVFLLFDCPCSAG